MWLGIRKWFISRWLGINVDPCGGALSKLCLLTLRWGWCFLSTGINNIFTSHTTTNIPHVLTKNYQEVLYTPCFALVIDALQIYDSRWRKRDYVARTWHWNRQAMLWKLALLFISSLKFFARLDWRINLVEAINILLLVRLRPSPKAPHELRLFQWVIMTTFHFILTTCKSWQLTPWSSLTILF
jgi:hypothetical protein